MIQGESRHKLKKLSYQSTSKKCFEMQIAKQTSVEEKVRMVDRQVSNFLGQKSATEIAISAASNSGLDSEPATTQQVVTVPANAYCYIDLSKLIWQHSKDPAIKVSHILNDLLE